MQDELKTRSASAPLVVVLFQVLHLLGVALCLFTLMQMWDFQALIRLMLSRLPIIGLLGGQIPFLIMFALIAFIGLFGLFKIERMVWMLQRGEAIRDAAVRLRIGLYVLVALLCFCIFVLSTPESFAGPFRLRHPIAAWIAASFAYGIWWALPSLKSRFSDKSRRRLALIAMNVTLTLILAEVTLRVLSLVWSSPLLITESTSSQIRRESERMQPGAERFSFPINSGGHYDTEFLPRSERTLPLVVTIGDSFSYGVVPHYYHYTTVAEREFPGAEIYNIGFPGTNPADYLYHLVEEALPLEPDLIIISLYVGNDIIAEAPPAAPTRWYDAENYLLGIVWHRLQILRRTQSTDWTKESSGKTSEDLTVLYPWLTDPSLESPSLSEETFLALETGNAYVGAATHPNVYERFFSALRKIEDAAGDVPLAFLILPDEYQINDALWEAVVERNELPLQRDLPQVKIREWAASGNRDIVDLLPLFLAEEPLADGQRHLYHLRDTHINARGNAVAGKALGKFIEARLSGDEIPDFGVNSPQEASALQQTAEPQNAVPQNPSPQNAAPQNAEPENPSPQNAAPQNAEPRGEMSSEDATAILLDFGAVVADVGLNGNEVFDESLLKHPKDQIISAIVIILNGEIAADQKDFAKEAALVLAFFQPGVGGEGVAIDSIRSGELAWRKDVEAEMQKNNREVASRTQGK